MTCSTRAFPQLEPLQHGIGEAGLCLTVVCCVCRYLTCTNYDFSYDRSKNLRPKRNIKTAMQHEIMLYGIAQKEQMGFDKAVEECKHRMSRYGVTPNMLVLPPQMLLYMASIGPLNRNPVALCAHPVPRSFPGAGAGAEAHVQGGRPRGRGAL